MSSTGAKSQTISPQSNDGSNEATGSIITPPSGKGKHEEGSGGIQLRTSARVSKKLKLEAEAAAQIQPDPKKGIIIIFYQRVHYGTFFTQLFTCFPRSITKYHLSR